MLHHDPNPERYPIQPVNSEGVALVYENLYFQPNRGHSFGVFGVVFSWSPGLRNRSFHTCLLHPGLT